MGSDVLADAASVHPTAIVEGGVTIGDGTSVWDAVHTFVRIPAAALVAFAALGGAPESWRVAAALLAGGVALSVHGNANGVIPRERVVQSYRVFMKEHPEIAGYVAQDLAAWQYWDAVPEYVALMKSEVRQQYPSRVAILAYLRQSPSAEAREFRAP